MGYYKGEIMREDAYCTIYFYTNYAKGKDYYFEDRYVAEYARYMDSQEYHWDRVMKKGFRLPISPVQDMMVRYCDLGQYHIIKDLGVDVVLDDLEMGDF